MTRTRSSDPLVGQVLDGRYEVHQRLARGGMATVYRAWDRRLERIVAIKVMHEGLGDGADYAAKFDREARAAAGLSDQNVVSIFDQGVDHGRPYIVMEFIQGPTLRNVITKHAPFSPLQAIQMIEPVAAALAVAHEAGLIHRDVKPENVLISESGAIKVADFGLARSAQAATVSQGVLIGTVSYMPPELLTNHHADSWSDVYSVGIMLFEMLTGTKPYTSETPIGVVYRHINENVPAPSSVLARQDPDLAKRSPIPDYIDALIMSCTRRNPASRPADGRELLHRVRKARRALERGIGNDEALVAQMFPASMLPWSVDQLGANEPTDVVERVDQIEHTPRADELRQELAGYQPAPRPDPVLPPPPGHSLGETASNGLAHRPARERFPRLTMDQVHRRRRFFVVSVLVLMLTAVIGTSTWWMVSGRYANVPAVVNMSREEAARIAAENDFAITFTEDYSETVAAGMVISTDPKPGDRVLRSTTITAVVSKGPERYPVPPIIGLSLSDVRIALSNSNLTTGDITEAYSDTIPVDHIISASYNEGDLLKRDTPVDLVVSIGREPVSVPNVTKMPKEEAIATLEGLGLVVQISEEKHDATVAAGKVISQSPAEASTLYRGEVVTLVISKGPEMTEVPDVIGMRRAEGVRALQDAGFEVEVINSSNPFQTTITATDPKEGSQAPKGSKIKVTLGS